MAPGFSPALNVANALSRRQMLSSTGESTRESAPTHAQSAASASLMPPSSLSTGGLTQRNPTPLGIGGPTRMKSLTRAQSVASASRTSPTC
ncbi:unnamed protein product [Staurois parvus]|uniref:Uncharacterized protein n=1 Tax=Staurois parvus TaxID=386267 RepID=A0ABN9FNN9_9NEOB|nr:unnamed protein product [Staurois parvus]